jgi:DNA-directed RNA polymerase specialized sigma24 family protein
MTMVRKAIDYRRRGDRERERDERFRNEELPELPLDLDDALPRLIGERDRDVRFFVVDDDDDGGV